MKKSFTTVVSGAVVTLAMCGCNITTDGQAMTNTQGVAVDAEVADRLEHAAINGEPGEIRLGAADRFGRNCTITSRAASALGTMKSNGPKNWSLTPNGKARVAGQRMRSARG